MFNLPKIPTWVPRYLVEKLVLFVLVILAGEVVIGLACLMLMLG